MATGTRQRSSSVQKMVQEVSQLPLGQTNYSQVEALPDTSAKDGAPAGVDNKPGPPQLKPWEEPSKGFLDDLRTMKWMRYPASSLRMMLVCFAAWGVYEALQTPLALADENPFTRLFVISHPLPKQIGETRTYYGKGIRDVPFLAFYIIVFSFVRQSHTEYVIKPYARWLGLKGGKAQRFVDQGYAVSYWGSSSVFGLWVMSHQPTWWYDTTEFWRSYPHWRLPGVVKSYYLLQFAYWLQQMLLLTLRIEKPRSDFVELCIHHCVTLWLIGWSYVANLTMIGTAIFVSMDVPDTFLGVSKCINYTRFQRTSEVTFAIFLVVWTYFRHWLNLRMLYSVYYEYDIYVPPSAKFWQPNNAVYLTKWMKWQVFAPILMLQLLNLFWYYLIWRIVIRILIGQAAKDVREDEDED